MSQKVFCVPVVALVVVVLSTSIVVAQAPVFPTSFTELATLTPSDVNGPISNFGFTVAIAGNTAVVGAPFANSNTGAAYVFVESANGWSSMTQTAELSPSDSTAGIEFGISVAISGNTIVVGSVGHNAAYVFTKPASGWTNMTENAILSQSSNGIGDGFGQTVAINQQTIAVGASATGGDTGRVDVFTEPSGGWVSAHPTGSLSESNGTANDFFGTGIAISGSTIVVGAEGLSKKGSAYIFLKPTAGWAGNHTPKAQLLPSDGASDNFFGDKVAISGSTVVVGAEGAKGNLGAAYVFVKPSSGWKNMNQTAELTASDGVTSDGLGASVSITGKTVIAGAPSNGGPGKVYTFDEPAAGWSNETQTTELTVAGSQNLGISVMASGTTMIAGARDSGTAYIFGEQ